MNKQSYIRQITGIVAALACIAASGCNTSSPQAQSGSNAQAPCVADKTCPGYPTTVAGRPAAPPPTTPMAKQ